MCAQPGDRIVAVIPPADAFGDAGAPDLGLDPGQSMVLVADVESVEDTPEQTPAPLTPAPEPSAWTTDIPEVTLGDAPVVTIPDTAPPTEYELTVLEEGDGEVVPNGATVTIDYQGTSWDTGEVFDQSYGRSPATFPTTGVIPGFAGAIVGQKTGSTVLVSIPPTLAYGTDPSAHELGGQTLVFLIRIESFTS
jgi:peptidylprolyl isomerase